MHTMTKPVLLSALLLACAGARPTSPLPRAQAGPPQLPLPTAREHLSGYLGIRHRLTGESPWVVVCGTFSNAEIDSLAPAYIRAGVVRSIQAADAEGCHPPNEARANSTIGAILIKSIEFTETSVVLTAQRWRGARSPWEWRERYRFLEGDRQLSMDFFSAID